MFQATIRFGLLAVLVGLTSCLSAGAQTSVDVLPSWNDGTAKQAILDLVDTADTRDSERKNRHCLRGSTQTGPQPSANLRLLPANNYSMKSSIGIWIGGKS
jgi:hypothetical protein